MSAITIEQLYQELGRWIAIGKGKKKILLSNDDEGNGYHEMFYMVSGVEGNIGESCQLPYGVKIYDAKKDYVILG